MGTIPVNNIINVSITNTPQGISERNVNSVALFTNETTTSLEAFDVCISASQVAELYGTSSLAAQMANALFAQSPNIRTGNGRLICIPMLAGATDATAGSWTSANISANLSDMIAVTSGDIRVTINSVNYDLTGLRFTSATTFDDIAAIIQAKLVDGLVEATGSTGIKITSKKVGTTSTVVLAAVPAGTGTALNGSGYLNGAGGTSASGTDSAGETISAAVARTEGAVGYTGLLTTLSLEDAAITAIATTIQAKDKLFHYAGASTQDVAGIGTSLKTAGNTHTRFKVYTPGITEAKLMNAAYVGRAHSVNFSGSNTTSTMHLKQLATITPDLGITQTLYTAAETAGTDLYVSYEGVSAVDSTGGNDYFDNVYNDLALKFALEASGFNFLRQTNTKVPQTESGMNGLKNAYAQVCERFVRNQAIAPGSWTSSERFGDPVIFDNNILVKGYYIYSLPIVEQSSIEREAREAPLVQIAIKRAGALQSSDVIVLIND